MRTFLILNSAQNWMYVFASSSPFQCSEVSFFARKIFWLCMGILVVCVCFLGVFWVFFFFVSPDYLTCGLLSYSIVPISMNSCPQRFEELYMKECMKARPNPTAKFNYAWALIRSRDVSLETSGFEFPEIREETDVVVAMRDSTF